MKGAVRVMSMYLGKDHRWTKECEDELLQLTKLAVQRGAKLVETEKLAEEAAKADAVAAELMASSGEEKPRSKNKKKKKGKK
jgi:hypothetical protein